MKKYLASVWKWVKEVLFKRIPIKILATILISILIPQHFFIGDNPLRISEFLLRVTIAFLCIFIIAYPIVAVVLFLFEKVLKLKITKLKWIVLSLILLGTLIFFSDFIYFAYVSLRFDKYESTSSYTVAPHYGDAVTDYCGFISKFINCTSSKLCSWQSGIEWNHSYCGMRDNIKIFQPGNLSLAYQFRRGVDRLLIVKKYDPECKGNETWERHHGFTINGKIVCYGGKYYPNIDGVTFQYLNSIYARDDNNIYIFGSSVIRLNIADPATFTIIAEEYAKDKDYIYGCAVPIKGVDRDTFKYVGGLYDFAKDKNIVYSTGGSMSTILIPPCKIGHIINADPNTFDFKKYMNSRSDAVDSNLVFQNFLE
jgi:hypothetical protein